MVNIILSIIFLASVEEIKDLSLSLENAIKIAINNNPSVLSAKKEVEAVSGRRLQMSAIPDIELEGEWVGIPYGSPLTKGEEAKIGLSQSFEFPGKRWLRNSMGSYDEKIAKIKLERQKLLVTANVKKTYYKVILYQKNMDYLEATIDLLKQFLETTNVKYRTGQIQYIEVVRAKVELAKVKNESIEIKKELSKEKKNLNLLLGKNPNEHFTVTLDITYKQFDKDIKQIQEEILDKNNTLKITKLYLEKNQKNKSLAYMSLLPDFNVGLYKSRAGGIDGWGAEFKMSFPLYFWWKQTGEIKEKSADLDITDIRLEALQRNIIRDIETNFEAVKTASEQVENFEQNLLPEIEDILKTGINSYQTAQIDTLNLIDIYRTYKITKIEYVKTLYIFFSALADLEIAGEEEEKP